MTFMLACDKHRQENEDWYAQDRIDYPDSPDRERFGRRIVYVATTAVEPVCPNCRVLSEIKF